MEDKFKQACEMIKKDDELKVLAAEKDWTKYATRKIDLLKNLGFCSTKEPDQNIKQSDI